MSLDKLKLRTFRDANDSYTSAGKILGRANHPDSFDRQQINAIVNQLQQCANELLKLNGIKEAEENK